MATIGKVTISGGQRSTIVAQNFAPRPNVSLSEITDVDTTGVQDGDALVYDSATGKYVTTTVQAFVTEISGGQF
jgi:hypothetical protein